MNTTLTDTRVELLTTVCVPLRWVSITWVPICAPLRLMANLTSSAAGCAAAAVDHASKDRIVTTGFIFGLQFDDAFVRGPHFRSAKIYQGQVREPNPTPLPVQRGRGAR